MKKLLAFLLTLFVTSLPGNAWAAQPVALYDGTGHAISSTFDVGTSTWFLNTNATLNEVATGTNGAAAPVLFKVAAGLDGGGLIRPLLTDTTGKLQITSINGSVGTVGSAVPTSATFMGVQSGANLVGLTYGQALMAASLPVTLASDQTLPLPTGASTSALQTTGNTSLSSIDGKLTTTASGLKVDVQASVLPTGAATSANQTNGTQQTQIVQGGNTATVSVGGALKVDASATTQPVSGTVTANIGTTNGLALDATTSAMSAKLPATLGQKTMANSMSVTVASDQSALPVTGTFWQATQPVSGTFWQATQPVSGTFWQATQPVSIAAAIPTKAPINSTASMSQSSVTTTGSTIGLIANANEVVVQNDNSSTDCIRYAFGSTATSTSGMVLQPGQDSGAIHSGAALSVTACSGTQKVNVQSMAQ